MMKQVVAFILVFSGLILAQIPPSFGGGWGPSVEWVRVTPAYIAPDGRTLITISAKVIHPQGARAIKDVVINLIPIGGFGNSRLGDDGWLGDQQAGDGVYTILASVAKDTPFGQKRLMVTAFDQSGWKTFQEGVLDVLDMPSILGVYASRSRIPADGRTPLLLTTKVYSPTGLTRIKAVLMDLTEIGGEKNVLMRNDGKNEDVRVDDFWSLKVAVAKTVKSGRKVLRIGAVNHLGRATVKEIVLWVGE